MNMDVVISGSLPEKFVSTWMSFVVLRISSEGTKLKFREIEQVALKICVLNSHLSYLRISSKEIQRITNDIHVETNFSGKLSDITS